MYGRSDRSQVKEETSKRGEAITHLRGCMVTGKSPVVTNSNTIINTSTRKKKVQNWEENETTTLRVNRDNVDLANGRMEGIAGEQTAEHGFLQPSYTRKGTNSLSAYSHHHETYTNAKGRAFNHLSQVGRRSLRPIAGRRNRRRRDVRRGSSFGVPLRPVSRPTSGRVPLE